MKILVIDDTQKHLDSAVQTLVGHDVTLCSSYDEALGLLEPKFDSERRQELYKQYKESGLNWEEARNNADNETRLPYWDVVLSDLLMQVGEHTHGQKVRKMVGEELSFGFALGLTAARHGAKYVGVLTDTNHHNSPASSMLDTLDNESCDPHIFTVDGAKVLITNYVHYYEFDGEEEEKKCFACHGNKAARLCPSCEGSGMNQATNETCRCIKRYNCSWWNSTGIKIDKKKGKHWGRLLDRLLA